MICAFKGVAFMILFEENAEEIANEELDFSVMKFIRK
jgi:hypothetical protein